MSLNVADYKRIRGGIVFPHSIPRNTMGKVSRRESLKWGLLKEQQQVQQQLHRLQKLVRKKDRLAEFNKLWLSHQSEESFEEGTNRDRVTKHEQ